MLKINHSKGTEQKIKTTIDNITLLKKSYSFISWFKKIITKAWKH